MIKIINKINGCSFFTIDVQTSPQMNKTLGKGIHNPHHGRIQKITSNMNVIVFQNKTASGYQNMINKRLIEEGMEPGFEVGARRWGVRRPGTPIIEHNGNLYLEVVKLTDGDTSWLYNGQPIEYKDICGLRESGSPSRGLSKAVEVRVYSFESIRRLTGMGITWIPD